MSSPYKYSIDDAVLQIFSVAQRRQREELLQIFACLSRQPFTQGDFEQKDKIGRPCQVKRFGRWMVTYWPEHLVDKIHILDVERLD